MDNSNNNVSTTRPYTAKYLVLLHSQAQPRALLFNGEHDFLAELEDDGFVVDSLVRAGTPCPPPTALPLDEVMHGPMHDNGQLECYTLG
jgi:hypothetical protein